MNVIKLRIFDMRLSWIFVWVLNAITCVLMSNWQRETYRQKRMRQCDHRGRDWSDILHKPWNASSHQKLEEARNDSALEPSEGMWSYQHPWFGQVILILDFWPPEPKIDVFLAFQGCHVYVSTIILLPYCFCFYSRQKKLMQFWYQTTDKLLRTQDY